MKNTFIAFIDRTLDTRVTPLAYVFALTGMVWGFAFTFLPGFPGVSSTVLYQYNALFGVSLWGIFMLGSSISLLYGLFTKKARVVMLSAFLLFLCWTSGAVVYGMAGEWAVRFPLAIINILCYGYYYLAASLDRLWDYSPQDKDRV